MRGGNNPQFRAKRKKKGRFNWNNCRILFLNVHIYYLPITDSSLNRYIHVGISSLITVKFLVVFQRSPTASNNDNKIVEGEKKLRYWFMCKNQLLHSECIV